MALDRFGGQIIDTSTDRFGGTIITDQNQGVLVKKQNGENIGTEVLEKLIFL